MKRTMKYPFTIDAIVGNNASETEATNTDGESQINQKCNKRLRSPPPLEENPAQRHHSSSVALQQLYINQHQRVPPLHPHQHPLPNHLYYHQQRHPLTAPYILSHSNVPVPAPPALPINMPDVRAIPAYLNSPRELQQRQQNYLMAAAQFGMARQAALAQGMQGIPQSLVLAAQHAQFLRFSGGSFILPRPKRIRTQFTPVQLLKLEETFELNQYIVGSERKALANQLGLSETKVKVWFQNRRTKTKQKPDSDGGSCGTDSSSEHHLQHDAESQSSEESEMPPAISDSDEEELEIVQ